MIRTATPTTTTSAGAKRTGPTITLIIVIVLLAIVVIGTGVGFIETSQGATSYACMSISHNGNNVTVKTNGLIHFLDNQYYISCAEGANLPSSSYRTSCLTVTSKVIPASISVGASTRYYYLSGTPGHDINLVGTSASTNASEIITPAGVSITVSC
jgi:hypothetical protein